MDIVFAGISLLRGVPKIIFSSFVSLRGLLVWVWRRSHVLLSSSASDVASFGRVGEEVCCKNDLTLPLVIWRNESPDDIPLRVDSRIEFRVELMKFVVAFRRKLICDISHLNILPNGVFLKPKYLINSECCQAWYYNHNQLGFENTRWVLRWFRYV